MSLVLADARALPLVDACVQCVVTSPPYWGLRDYGTAQWVGGDDGCHHRQKGTHVGPASTLRNDGRQHVGPYAGEKALTEGLPFKATCGHCGAQRVDAQIGLEATPDAYVAALVAVFREVWRVLRPDGIVWLVLGDTYANAGLQQPQVNLKALADRMAPRKRPRQHNCDSDGLIPRTVKYLPPDLKPKDLVGIPWRVAFALQTDGWWLRSDIIWSKPNPMPESVTDRPTKAHEYVFLLSKRERYYYDAAAIAEPQSEQSLARYLYGFNKLGKGIQVNGASYTKGQGPDGGFLIPSPQGRNVRSVWTINPQPYSGAHFATFPEALVERCVLAGSRCGDLVLDPFLGSGTVGRVAISLGRRAVGCDLSPAYLTLARERLQVTRGLPFSFEDEPAIAEVVTPPDTLIDGLESPSNGANQSHVVSSLFPKDFDQVGIFPSESHGSPGAAGASVYLLRDIPKERPKSRKTPNGKSPTWDQTTEQGQP